MSLMHVLVIDNRVADWLIAAELTHVVGLSLVANHIVLDLLRSFKNSIGTKTVI